MRKYIVIDIIFLFFIAMGCQAIWGSPDWPNNPPDPGHPPPTCYKTVQYCTEWLADGHCKHWDTRQEEVACPKNY